MNRRSFDSERIDFTTNETQRFGGFLILAQMAYMGLPLYWAYIGPVCMLLEICIILGITLPGNYSLQ